MNPIIRYSAIVLLLLFVRVMIPDALLLRMHHHAHLEHSIYEDVHQAKIDNAHKHCPVEDLFDTSFQGSNYPFFAHLVYHKTPYTSHLASTWLENKTDHTQGRAPPLV